MREDDHNEQLEQLLGAFIDPVKRLARNSRRLLSEPGTALDEMTDRMTANLAQVVPEGGTSLTALLGQALSDGGERYCGEIEALAKDARKRLRLRGGSLVLQALERANATVSSGVLALIQSPIVSRRRYEHVCLALGQLAGTRGLRGEVRARHLCAAIAHMAETLHKPYAAALWKVHYIGDGRQPPAGVDDMGHGNILAELRRVLVPGEAESLLVFDAAHFRNAHAHGGVEWDSRGRKITMRDRKWETKLTPAEIEKCARRLLRLWWNYHEAREVLTMAALYGPLARPALVALQALVSKDPVRIAAANAEFQAAFESVIVGVRPLMNLPSSS